MNELHQTKGAKIMISVLKKHRKLVIACAILEIITFFIRLLYSSDLQAIQITSRVLSVLLPLGIIFAVALKNIQIIRITLAVGLIGQLFSLIYALYKMIKIIILSNSININTLSLALYLTVICITIFFLMIVIFNISSRKLGIWIFSCVLLNLGIFITEYIYVIVVAVTSFNGFKYLPQELRYREIITTITVGIMIIYTLIWAAIELLIARRLIKQEVPFDENLQTDNGL